MLDIKNIPVTDINQNKKINATFVRMKNLMDVKMASYLRYLGTKNAVNRASDYHYLCLAVTDSTAPVNGIDYIHPSVKPVVDYATAVITKGLAPNGEINLEFVADGEDDVAPSAAPASAAVASATPQRLSTSASCLQRGASQGRSKACVKVVLQGEDTLCNVLHGQL